MLISFLFLSEIYLVCHFSRIMSVISLVNYAGNSKLPDDIMRSLVTRSTDNASLSELARAYGYTEGPAVGVAVNVSPDTGEIRGGTLALYGEDNPVVFKANMGVRKIWAEAISAVQLNRFSLDCSWQSEEGQDPRQYSLLGRRVLSLF